MLNIARRFLDNCSNLFQSFLVEFFVIFHILIIAVFLFLFFFLYQQILKIKKLENSANGKTILFFVPLLKNKR